MTEWLEWIMNFVDTPVMALCGRPRKSDGRPCENPVRRAGMACSKHGGPGALASRNWRVAGTRTAARQSPDQWSVPIAPTPPRTPGTTAARQQAPKASPPPRKEQERKRVEKTAQFCADLITNGWQETVADRIMAYAPTTWGRMRRSSRTRTCKALARMARVILKTNTLIHKEVGRLFAWVAGRFGADDAVQAFAKELASNMPLPTAKTTAVARGLQVAGVLLCVMDNKSLQRCDCFIDLVHAETEERVKQILIAGMSDWVNLAKFQPRAMGKVS
jgi:hypothetical protein